MPHIHSGTKEHDLTVTAYIVRVDGEQPKALLHMHRKLHVLLPVGGHVELNETPWQALAHEVEEESGYVLSQLGVMQPASRITKMSKVVQHPYPLSVNTHSVPKDHFHTDLQYGLVVRDDPKMSLQDGEATDLRWLTLDEIKSMPAGEIFENTAQVYEFLLTEVLANWDTVAATDFVLEFPQEYV